MTARQKQRALLDIRDLQTWCAAAGRPFEMVEDEDDLLTCHVTVNGPEETPYAGGQFVVSIQLPKAFPMKSPSVAFKTPIWHPNVEKSSGSVCLDVLQDRWSPVTRLVSVVETYLPELLSHPNVDDPLNGGAAAMMKDSKEEYTEYVRVYTRKYAADEKELDLPEISSTFDEDFAEDFSENDD
jgi:ubiquitin-conjugating enzyme E2 H